MGGLPRRKPDWLKVKIEGLNQIKPDVAGNEIFETKLVVCYLPKWLCLGVYC